MSDDEKETTGDGSQVRTGGGGQPRKVFLVSRGWGKENKWSLLFFSVPFFNYFKFNVESSSSHTHMVHISALEAVNGKFLNNETERGRRRSRGRGVLVPHLEGRAVNVEPESVSCLSPAVATTLASAMKEAPAYVTVTK